MIHFFRPKTKIKYSLFSLVITFMLVVNSGDVNLFSCNFIGVESTYIYHNNIL